MADMTDGMRRGRDSEEVREKEVFAKRREGGSEKAKKRNIKRRKRNS